MDRYRGRKGLEAGESSGSAGLGSRASPPLPAPLPSFKNWGGVPVPLPVPRTPLPEPRTPRTSRSSERKRAQKLKKLQEQKVELNEEIRIAHQAPRVSSSCREVAEFFQHSEDPFISTQQHNTRPSWSRWLRSPAGRRRFSCCFI